MRVIMREGENDEHNKFPDLAVFRLLWRAYMVFVIDRRQYFSDDGATKR
jgi:hypothetical protein